MTTTFFEDNATIGTDEYSLPADTASGVPTSQTDVGIAQLWLDLSAMTVTEEYQLTFYEKVQSGGSQNKAVTVNFVGLQSNPYFVAPAIFLKNGWDMTMKKIAGNDRNIGWSIRIVDAV